MIEAPETYSEWINILEIFRSKTNDSEVLKAMKDGHIEWQIGVAERFSRKLIEAVNDRMNAASDKFQRDISRAGGSEGAIVNALLTLRKEMAFLLDAINLPALPENYRKQYIALVTEQADKMQHSLQESAKRDRSGKMLNIIKNHKVNVF